MIRKFKKTQSLFCAFALLGQTAIIAVLPPAVSVLAQSTTGELRLTVTDPAGLRVKSGTVDLVSQGTQYSQTFTTNQQGGVDAKRLPYPRITVHAAGRRAQRHVPDSIPTLRIQLSVLLAARIPRCPCCGRSRLQL